jgi:uracil-DNA glycosylase family 4
MPKSIRSSPVRNRLLELEDTVVGCRLCPRLVRYREQVARQKVARHAHEDYWGRPVPGFGDPGARLVVVGLAPAAHGGNRTGRMFTGDRSGDWLFRALHKFGFANQAASASREDGLRLRSCFITAAARCAPPGNKPLTEEFMNCRRYLLGELRLLVRVRVVVALGGLAARSAVDAFRELQMTDLARRPPFGHGNVAELSSRLTLIMSYHPSQQNTFTGRLTEEMFDAVFRKATTVLESGI